MPSEHDAALVEIQLSCCRRFEDLTGHFSDEEPAIGRRTGDEV